MLARVTAATRALGALLCAALAAAPSGCRAPAARELEGAYPVEELPRGTVRAFQLVAAPATVPLLDGRLLEVWAYNGQVPGPTLRVELGETISATLVNRLPQPTTIHWHGVRLPNAMDGVPGVTQPPVAPGERFTYEFTPRDAGTFWFHPHLSASEQVERGLYGVLVVEDGEPSPFTLDVVWVLDDLLLDEAGRIFGEFNTRHDLQHDGRWGNIVTVNGDRAARLEVAAGARVRLRLVDVANGRVFRLSFGALQPQGIAVDGLYAARPFDVQGYELAPGNRLDLDLTIPPSFRGQTVTVTDDFTGRVSPLAEIVVRDELVATPGFPSPARAHVPAWSDAVRRPPRAEYRLNARAGGPFGVQWTLNGEAFDHAAHHAPPAGRRLPLGELSHLRFVNDSFRLHPMHLHGMFFRLLARNGQRVDEPHFRDTVLLHAKETVDVALVPTDRGRWMMHCHILEHAESGMMTLVDVR
jgi:FtsP/CotA-like multicopper oxidase with cupredoxin domain